MLGFSGHRRIAAQIATDATFTAGIKIEGANRIAFEIPTFSVGLSTASANVYALVAHTNTDSAYHRLKDVGVYSASSGIQDWETPLSAGNYTVLCRPATGFNWVKLELATGGSSVTATAALSCYVHHLQ